MAITTYIWVLVGIGIIYIVYDYFFKKKGTKVIIRPHRIIKGSIYEINPQKKYIGWNKDINGVEKLFLPNSLSNKPQEGLNPSDFVPNDRGIPVVNWLFVTEKYGVPFTPTLTEDINYKIKIVEKDVTSWAQNERIAAEARLKQPDKWGWLKQAAAIGIVAVICFLMVAYTINKISDMTGEVTETNTNVITALNKFGENFKAGTSGVSVETTADAPPGSGKNNEQRAG